MAQCTTFYTRKPDAFRGPVEPPNATELPGLGYTPRNTHAALLDRYQARLVGAAWYLLPDDGYIHAHLAQHMEEAGRAGEVHALLAEETSDGRNGWYVAQERLRPSRWLHRGPSPRQPIGTPRAPRPRPRLASRSNAVTS